MSIRLATEADIAPLLAISNWAALHTPANFAIEPEPLDDWLESWRTTHERYPWLVVVDENSVAQASRLCGDGTSDAARQPSQPVACPGETPGPPPRVVGFAKASPHRGRCAYAYTAEVSVYVHPEQHGRGVGRALYARLIPMLKAQGFVTLLAGITLPNAASQRLHESFGFQRIGVFERVGWKFGAWHDVSYWQLTLRNEAVPPERLKRVAEVTAQP